MVEHLSGMHGVLGSILSAEKRRRTNMILPDLGTLLSVSVPLSLSDPGTTFPPQLFLR